MAIELTDPNAVTAGATVVLVVATLVLAALTAWLAIEQRNTRRDAAAPNVVVSIEPAHATILKVRVSNIGRGLARDVRISCEPPLIVERGSNEKTDLATTKLFSPSSLRPDQVLERWLGKYETFAGRQFAITVSFKDKSGLPYMHTYEIDIGMLDRTQFEREKLDVIAQDVKRLADRLDNLSTGSSRLNVNVFNSNDRRAKQAEELAWIDEFNKKSNGDT
jgi:hypothetical protein